MTAEAGVSTTTLPAVFIRCCTHYYQINKVIPEFHQRFSVSLVARSQMSTAREQVSMVLDRSWFSSSVQEFDGRLCDALWSSSVLTCKEEVVFCRTCTDGVFLVAPPNENKIQKNVIVITVRVCVTASTAEGGRAHSSKGWTKNMGFGRTIEKVWTKICTM